MNLLFRLSRETTLRIDQKLRTDFKPILGGLYRKLLRGWSPFRRKLDPFIIRNKYRLGFRRPQNLKLHLGCGHKHFDGYVNVDLWISEAADVVCDISKLPWPDNSAMVIESYHIIEHISHTKILDTLEEWYRILKTGGYFIIECPHFDEAIKQYLEGNEKRLLNIFGRQRFLGDVHLYGYNPKRLIEYLKEAGFSDFTQEHPQSSQSLDEPCFRIECRK